MNDVTLEKQDLNRLAELYMTTGDENYFNLLWKLVKPFSIVKGKRYMSIPWEDRESISMECLYNCCKKIMKDLTQKKEYKLLTLYGTILDNRLYDMWVKRMHTLKYKVNEEAASLEYMMEERFYQPATQTDEFNINFFLSDCKLIDMEISMVALINEGYKKTEILKQLKISNNDYNNLLQSVKEKIKNNYLTEEFTM